MLVICTPFLFWLVLYVAVRLFGISPTRLVPWLKCGGVVLLGLAVVFEGLDWNRLVYALLLNFWGFLFAAWWIVRRYKRPDEGTPTSLKLS